MAYSPGLSDEGSMRLIHLSIYGISLLVSLAVFMPAFVRASDLALHQLRVVLNSDILSTNPGVRRDYNTDVVLNHIFESLVAYRQDISVGPLLAEEIVTSEDGKKYTFQIRKGLTFHNGETVTARDVKWSWDRFLDPVTSWTCRRWFVASEEGDDDPGNQGVVIKAIQVVDEYAIEFELEERNAVFLDLLANYQCLPAVIHHSSVDAEGNWLEPIGTGPYKLKRWQRGEFIELEKFNGYIPRDEPQDGLTGSRVALVDEIRFQILPDTASARAALLSGNIDVISQIPMHMAEDLASQKGIQLSESDTLGWSEMLIQTADPLLRDPKFRQAMAHAINREEVMGFTEFGHASVNSSGVPVAHPAHTAVHDQWYEYSIEKAKRLLKEINYRGQVIKIQTNRKHPAMYNNALVVQAMLQMVGINSRLELLDWASQLANYYSGRFQLMTFGFSAIANPTLRYAKLVGSKKERPNTQWDSPEAAELLKAAWVSRSPEESTRIYEQLHLLMVRDVPLIGLYNARLVSAFSTRVHGFSPWPLELDRYWGVSIEQK